MSKDSKSPKSVYIKLLQNAEYSYPLYKYKKEYLEIVSVYMLTLLGLPDTDPIHEQLKSYKLLSEIRMIFESNRIENAGMNFSETRKLINEFFPEIPSNYSIFRKLNEEEIKDIIAGKKIDLFFESISAKGLSKQIIPTVQFGSQSRAWVEVARHYLGYLTIESYSYKYYTHKYAFKFANHIKKNYSLSKKKEWIARFPDFDFDSIEHPLALSEEFLKKIHSLISEDLLPKDAGVKPGEYRIDDRAAGVETVFVAPKLIPQAMNNFIAMSNSIVLNLEQGENPDSHPISVASKISHQLVRIHPFPDFNGRLSRLILVYILKLLKIPFAVSIRGGARDKQRYISALKKADLGNYSHYEAIIAKNILDSFFEIDSNLEPVGIKTFRQHMIDLFSTAN